eukprot:TRINITY_DN2742_c0_g1_i1.p1 TRINITY_DN2742_c0_g1~~TRINITY_DN2742_c0_g1_i1.p1  ORF type:complete len:229 (-),score=81.94 TRINITY_DN2742_c0_g1_i1:107-754(-)
MNFKLFKKNKQLFSLLNQKQKLNLKYFSTNSTNLEIKKPMFENKNKNKIYYEPLETSYFVWKSLTKPCLSSISFLNKEEFIGKNCPIQTIIGWYTDSEINEIEPQKVNFELFEANEEFVNILHETIVQFINENGIYIAKAQKEKSGWIHVVDYRQPLTRRTPWPEDIFGSVKVENGIILPQTYQRMPTYRLCTAAGLFQFDEWFNEKLLNKLQIK